jgi:hypothetical protein
MMPHSIEQECNWYLLEGKPIPEHLRHLLAKEREKQSFFYDEWRNEEKSVKAKSRMWTFIRDLVRD